MYKMYAMALTEENIALASEQRFHRMTPGYILIFTKDNKPENSIEIIAKEANHLTSYDREWLRSCVELILIESVTSEDDTGRTMEMLERFEAELKSESKKINNGE